MTRSGAGTEAEPYLYAAASGDLRIWTKDGSTPRNPADLGGGGDYLKPGVSYALSQLPAADRLTADTWRVFIEGVAANAAGDEIQLAVNPGSTGSSGGSGGSAGGASTMPATQDAVRVTPVAAPTLRVDGNRDRTITFDQADKTTEAKPYTFWLNNNRDVITPGRTIPLVGTVLKATQDSVPVVGGNADSGNNRINVTRDLDDFSRVQIAYDPTLKFDHVTLRFTHAANNTNPSIKLFRAVGADDKYVQDLDTAKSQIQSTANEPNGGPQTVTASAGLTLTRANSEKYVLPGATAATFIFEGVDEGAGELEVDFLQGNGENNTIATSSTYLNLKPINKLYEDWTVGDTVQQGTAPAAQATLTSDSTGYAAPRTDDEKNYILFVHGWRLNPFERRAFADTSYKRLFWAGYKGRFGMFNWPTETIQPAVGQPPLDLPLNYRRSEQAAWNSAAGLRGLLGTLKQTYADHVYMMAHSMGNIVASEALRLESAAANPQKLVNTYVASQAASPAEAYDAEAPQLPGPIAMMGKSDPNKQVDADKRVLADLRTPDFYVSDPTTHKPRFAGIGTAAGTMVNYYDSIDFALNAYPQIQWGKDLVVAQDPYHFNANANPPAFYRDAAEQQPLTWANDSYEIMSQIMQVRTNALGAQDMPHGAGKLFADEVNLNAAPIGFGGDPTEHSGQFRSDNMTRHPYWDQLLRTFKLEPKAG